MRKIIVIGIIVVLVVVAFLVVWQHSRDSKYRHDIAGTWTYNQDGAFTIAPDGSWSIMESKRKGTNSFAGTWQITDGVFYMTTTNSRIEQGPSAVGGVQRYRIVHVDDHTLIYGDVPNSGHQITRKRIH
jgi:hypothetical protein